MNTGAIRVLLVDDDQDERLIVGDMLRLAYTENFELLWAATYEEGLEIIQRDGCDVCLLDYRLGGRNGLELLAEITARPDYPQVILLSGVGSREVDLQATKGGAADFLLKGDLTAALLERSIRYAVERGRREKVQREAIDSLSLNQAKSAFLSSISHEMRTPMNAILGMADMLWESPLSDEQKRYLEVLRRAGDSLLVLVNDVLDLATFEAGRLKLERVEFDLEKVVDQVIDTLAPTARAKGLTLLAHLTPEVETAIVGDPNRLRQVLSNLAGNAVKFTHCGEILLSIRQHESGRAGHLEFAVFDTGIGIPLDKLEAIFNDFTQVDTSLTRKYGGTGLGLGISRRLVEAMGGGMTASSSPGQGSSFRFHVPFELARAKSRAVCADLGGKRVLLMDDNATSRQILAETLKGWGLECDAGPTPEIASEIRVDEMRYALALVSTGFPAGSGGWAVAEIKRSAPGLPIIVLAADGRQEDLGQRAAAGLAGYALKPVKRRHLLRLISEALAAREANAPASVLAEAVAPAPPDTPIRDAEHQAAAAAGGTAHSRILIVEDSRDNRILLQAYLQGCPYDLTFEENGQAGVERFASGHFDLILMDVQMPVMDGLTATRQIRALERERGSSPVVVIALTANAGSESVETSMNAGCTGHLAKPVSKPELLGALERHARRKPSGPAKPLGKAVRADGIAAMVPAFLARRSKEIPEMLKFLDEGDFARVAVLAHNVKGIGKGYGFPELSVMGAACEQAAKEKNGEAARAKILEMNSYLESGPRERAAFC